MSQSLAPNLQLWIPPRTSPTPTIDQGDPVQLLKGRGITEANKGDLHTLVKAFKEFADFRKDGKYNMTKDWSKQLVAIRTLLGEVANAADPPALSAPVTRGDLLQAVTDIKSAISSPSPTSYAAAAHRQGPSPPTRLTPPRPAPSPETQEKEIFISMKNATKDAPLTHLPATELTT